MANTFLTVNEIAKESVMRLNNNLVMAGLVHRDFSNEFADKGDTIQVKKPATFVANEFTTAIEAQDIEESNVLVKLDKIADVSVEVTSKQLSLNIQEFGAQIVQPAMEALAQKIDSDIMGLYADIPYTFGTAGSTPNSLAAIAGVGKVLNTNKAPTSNRSLVLDPEAQAALIVLDAIAGADKSGSTQALREASMGRILGFDSFMSQNVKTHTKGGYAALADVTAAGTAGETSVVLTSTAGTSTAKLAKGDILVIEGENYVVTAETSAAVDGVVTATVYPALKETVTASDVTFVASNVSNLGFHKNAFSLVTRPQELPLGGANGYIANYNGLPVRVTMGYSMSSKINTISFDILYGTKTLTQELAVRFLG